MMSGWVEPCLGVEGEEGEEGLSGLDAPLEPSSVLSSETESDLWG